MEQERRICCCGSRAWTQIIGWVHIASCSLCIVLGTMVLRGAAVISLEDERLEFMFDVLEQYWIYVLIHLLLCSIMGIVLVHGSLTENTCRLLAWRVYTSTWLFFSTILIIPFCFHSPTGSISWILTLFLPTLVVNGFFLWVVSVHDEEIENSRLQMLPLKV